jgi:glycosyltransferase involved in cell wall biosynthesis
MGQPRICIVPEYPLSLMTGGTLVQAIETRKALSKYVSGMRFELFNWSEEHTPADCYHFIGMPKYLARICSLVASSGRPYVVTVLMGSPRLDPWRLAAWRRRVGSWIGWNRDYHLAIQGANTLIVLNSRDARALADIFAIPLNRIRVIPVAVSEVFFQTQPDLWRSQYGASPFVLCVGAIQRRKNQLLLVNACNELRLPIVLVGGTLPGEDAYATQVHRAMTRNEELGGRRLRCDDTLLASAYAACNIYVLLSSAETQPASVLQAMALRKPILLAESAYARAYPFDGLPTTNQHDKEAVKHALLKLWKEQPPSRLPAEFTEPKVCQLLQAIYSSALTTSCS